MTSFVTSKTINLVSFAGFFYDIKTFATDSKFPDKLQSTRIKSN